MAESVSPSTRADARQNRERLLDAARSVLAERGFEADVTEIAARAGVGAGTLYRHFPNKEALILEVAREMANRTILELNELAATVDDASECLRRTMQVGFQRVKEYGQLTIALVAGTQPPAFDRVVNRLALGNMFSALIYRGIAQGQFRADVDVEYTVAVWFALVTRSRNPPLISCWPDCASPGPTRPTSDRDSGRFGLIPCPALSTALASSISPR
jgi:AcrR family transcriptional regulator